MANGFPEQFVSSLVEVSGCSLLDLGATLGVADVAYDHLGRPMRVSILHSPASPGCAEASSVLLSSSLVPLGDMDPSEGTRKLFVITPRGTDEGRAG